jgi:DNA-binding MarR family transcriptional regulator
MKDEKLTKKQLNVLNAIISFVDIRSKSPTYQELAEVIGITHVTAMQHVKTLRRKGWVNVSFRDSRSIKVLKRPNQEAFRFNFKQEVIYKPVNSIPLLMLNLNSLFPPIITDSSVIRTNDTTQSLPPTISNFLSGFEPIITKGCITECKGIRIPKYFKQVSVDHLFVNNYSTHYVNGDWRMGVYLPCEESGYSSNVFTALNYNSNQLSFDLNLPVQKNLAENKRFFDSINNNSTGFVAFNHGNVYQFSRHVSFKRGDLEVFILWSLTNFSILTADRKLKNNIIRNGGKVYFYNKRKEQVCPWR